jgi:hypothetical protein
MKITLEEVRTKFDNREPQAIPENIFLPPPADHLICGPANHPPMSAYYPRTASGKKSMRSMNLETVEIEGYQFRLVNVLGKGYSMWVRRDLCPENSVQTLSVRIVHHDPQDDFGRPVWVDVRAAGRRGGAATAGISTPAKRRAARANALLGGRPATTKLIFWVRRPGDRKDEADSTAEILVPQRVAVRLARALENDGTGMEVDDGLLARYRPAVDVAAQAAGGRFAGGHGITVVYPSGRTTEIRRKW